MVDLAHNSKNETIKLNATKDIMDRAGFKPVVRNDITSSDDSFKSIIVEKTYVANKIDSEAN